ncbi:MAG TPA: peptidylprolyl isomerase [Blastocatellia bacterium]|nr:peptidylprolyl isomerase [Blastocatellia bacterium]
MAAKKGDAVEVHYTGRLDDGTVFDSSEGNDPLAFTLGRGEVIEGFDQGVLGMEVGENKQIVIPAEQAYGEHNEALVQTVARDQIKLSVEPEVGMQIEMRTPDGTVIPLTISELSESAVTLDANHPLAGEQLHFDVRLVDIK